MISHVKKHNPTITNPEKVGELMIRIDNYHGVTAVRGALQLMGLTFCRSWEIRNAEWGEFDFKDKVWRITAAKMKMCREHLVPLSPQAVAVLNEMKMFYNHASHVFLNQRDITPSP